jgi:polynucleotide 5'-kinase involved in rRNA processing
VLVCGGKGVGKSTFLRYLTNKLLRAVGPVLYVDFDPGQAELTIPGLTTIIYRISTGRTVLSKCQLGFHSTEDFCPLGFCFPLS